MLLAMPDVYIGPEEAPNVSSLTEGHPCKAGEVPAATLPHLVCREHFCGADYPSVQYCQDRRCLDSNQFLHFQTRLSKQFSHSTFA